MNKKYNTYDHFDKLKCVENSKIMEIEKKFENFSIENDYDFGTALTEGEICLPLINLDLAKLISFYKNQNYTVEDLIEEIKLFNTYFTDITKFIDITKCETSREKSIIYYLFYFMTRCFFYICLHNNFMSSIETSNLFQIFFYNFTEIINSAKLCIEIDLKNSLNIINSDNDTHSKQEIKKKINQIFYQSFSVLKNYPNEFNDLIIRCNNFLSIILFSIDQYGTADDKEEISFIDFDTYSLFQCFVKSFNIIYEINEFYSIVDYKSFYNGGISKHLNLKRDFRIYIKNEKIRRKKRKELQKQKNMDKNDLNKIDIENDKESSDIELDDEEENDKYEGDKIQFTMFDYMWLFNPSAKNEIIRLFNIRRQNSNISRLTLNIRRENLIEDTLNEISLNADCLQNELRIKSN